MFIFIFLCFITTLFPLCAAWRRLRNGHEETNLFLFMGAVAYSFVFLYGLMIRLWTGDLNAAATTQQMYALVGQTGVGQAQINMLIMAVTVCLSFFNLVLGIIVQKTKRPITYCLVFAVGLLVFLCFVGSLFGGNSPLTLFFTACCGIMAYFAYILELTYKEFCVLGNIYLQAIICLLAALAPLMLCLRKLKQQRAYSALCISAVNFIVHGMLFCEICAHYWMPLEKGFDLCYGELVHLVRVTGVSYVGVNIIIFVNMFLCDLMLNYLIYRWVAKKTDDVLSK